MLINEAELRRIVKEELLYKQSLNEGLWDDAKQGLIDLTTSIIKKIASSGFKQKLSDAIDGMEKMPEQVVSVIDALKKGMAKTGESVKLDNELTVAKQLGALGKDGVVTMLRDDIQGSVHDKAKSMQHEAWETVDQSIALFEKHDIRRINEIGFLSGVGVGLAILGGLPILFKGLERLALALGATKIADLMSKIYHVLHKIEEKAVDAIIPDSLSFFVYNALWARGLKASKHQLNKEDYSKNVAGAKMKIEKIVYSALLIYFAWNGIKGALQAGASLFGFIEGTATAVKGAEIAKAGIHLADIADLVPQ